MGIPGRPRTALRIFSSAPDPRSPPFREKATFPHSYLHFKVAIDTVQWPWNLSARDFPKGSEVTLDQNQNVFCLTNLTHLWRDDILLVAFNGEKKKNRDAETWS